MSRRTGGRAAGRKEPPALGHPVRELEGLRFSFGPRAAARKLGLLAALGRLPVAAASRLLRLHETLLFVRAHPDSPAVLGAAEELLQGFGARLRRLEAREHPAADGLDESGIAATSVYCSYSLPAVRWLLERHPGEVELYAEAEGLEERLAEALPSLLLPAEAEAVIERYVAPLEWLERSGAGQGEAALRSLLGLLYALPIDEPRRVALWSALDVAVRWRLGEGDGSRTRGRAPAATPFFYQLAFARGPVDLAAASTAAAPVPEILPAARARPWIDAARAAVAVRLRDVHAFNHASAADVSVAELGEGLGIALYGLAADARRALPSSYGYLLVRNDVPVGYGDALLLADWGEINFHVFDSYRQSGSAWVYASVVGLFRRHLGVRYLFLNRYQFGYHNSEAIASGAFWFYEKLGFRPREREGLALWREERRRIEADPAHRSSRAVLTRLARGHMALALDGDGEEAERRWGGFHPMNVGLAVSRRCERAMGGDRARARRAASRRLAGLLGGRWSGAEAAALERLAPVLELVPGLEGLSAAARRALGRLVRAKAAPREIGYLRETQSQSWLAAALAEIGRAESGRPDPAKGSLA